MKDAVRSVRADIDELVAGVPDLQQGYALIGDVFADLRPSPAHVVQMFTDVASPFRLNAEELLEVAEALRNAALKIKA